MNAPENRSIGITVAVVIGFAVALAMVAYFGARFMDPDVSGAANTRMGLSFALLAGIGSLSALVGVLILWAGRHKANSNTRIAIIATLVMGAFLFLVALAAGTSSREPASNTVGQS
jgi:Na+/H+ antiporter NhaA